MSTTSKSFVLRSVAAFALACVIGSAPAFAQGGADGRFAIVRISSTAADALCVGGTGASPASCTGGAKAGNLSLSGVLTVSGTGVSLFNGAQNGTLSVQVENSTNGSAAVAEIAATAGSTLFIVDTFSQSYTTAGTAIAASVRVLANGTNGLNIIANNATGSISFYTGGLNLFGRMHASGGMSWGDTTDPGAQNFRVLGTATSVGGFVGNLTGNASTATSATSATNATNATNVAVTDDTTTDALMFPLWVTTASGNRPAKTSSTLLTFNPVGSTNAGPYLTIGKASEPTIGDSGASNASAAILLRSQAFGNMGPGVYTTYDYRIRNRAVPNFGSGAGYATLDILNGSSTTLFSLDYSGNLSITGKVIAGDNVVVPATKKIVLDGATATTHISESSAGVITFTGTGNNVGSIGPYYWHPSDALVLDTSKRLYFDGGSDTYAYEVAANNLRIVAGGSNVVSFGFSGNATEFFGSVQTQASGTITGGIVDTSGATATTVAGYVQYRVGSYDSIGYSGATLTLGGLKSGQWSAVNVYAGASGGVTLSSGATAWAAVSDERLKTKLLPIANAAQKVAHLRSGTGRYLTDSADVSRAFLIAQDVQDVLPEAVSIGDDGYLTLRYTDVIPLLVAANKELQDRIAVLERKAAIVTPKAPLDFAANRSASKARADKDKAERAAAVQNRTLIACREKAKAEGKDPDVVCRAA